MLGVRLICYSFIHFVAMLIGLSLHGNLFVENIATACYIAVVWSFLTEGILQLLDWLDKNSHLL